MFWKIVVDSLFSKNLQPPSLANIFWKLFLLLWRLFLRGGGAQKEGGGNFFEFIPPPNQTPLGTPLCRPSPGFWSLITPPPRFLWSFSHTPWIFQGLFYTPPLDFPVSSTPPPRISVHRHTRLGVATLQSVFSLAEFCFKNWAIVLRLSLNNISVSLHRSYHSFYFIRLVHLSINS